MGGMFSWRPPLVHQTHGRPGEAASVRPSRLLNTQSDRAALSGSAAPQSVLPFVTAVTTTTQKRKAADASASLCVCVSISRWPDNLEGHNDGRLRGGERERHNRWGGRPIRSAERGGEEKMEGEEKRDGGRGGSRTVRHQCGFHRIEPARTQDDAEFKVSSW